MPEITITNRAPHFVSAATALLLFPFLLLAQPAQAQEGAKPAEAGEAATLQGFVRDSDHRPIADATISLLSQEGRTLSVRSDVTGAYHFAGVRPGVYTLHARMAGYADLTLTATLAGEESKAIDLTLNSQSSGPQKPAPAQPQFFDQPHFTVAGVTDTTNLGGHGSDTITRNRDALARDTVALSQQPTSNAPPDSPAISAEKSLREKADRNPGEFDANYRLGKFLVDNGKATEAIPYLQLAARQRPRDYDNRYELALAYFESGDYERARTEVRSLLAGQDKLQPERPEAHHLLAEVDEKLGDPLEAVREYQRAAELNPSESNLFDWGAELLLHRAAGPAIEVFTRGNRLFPQSAHILTGLGAAWYAQGFFDRAVQRLCEASDINPTDPEPYLFMGKMQSVEVTESPEIAERLARFLTLQPQNALANYYYAVTLWKQWQSSGDAAQLARVKSLLERAISLDPRLGPAYLQLGILYFEHKDVANAIAAYQHAIEATPALEQAHYRLAQAYRQTGETSKAQAELKLYDQITKQNAEEAERQRHELQQFVYQSQEQQQAAPPQ